jgi:hypothetical protein
LKKQKEILYLETKADETHAYFCNYFKAAVSSQKALEILCQTHLQPDVLLEPLYPVQPQNHPQLKGAEPPTKWDLPVLHRTLA